MSTSIGLGMYQWYVPMVCTNGMYQWYVPMVCTYGMYQLYVPMVCTNCMYLWYVPTGMNIPGFIALVHEVPDVLKRSDCELRKVLNVGTEQGMLTDPQVPLVVGV